MKITYLQAILELQKDNFAIGPENGPRSEIVFKDPTIAPSEQEIQAKIQELQAAEPMRLLRIERNRRLVETDWVVIRAYSQKQDVSENWANYMQALRDLPVNSEPMLDEQGNLINVTWPEVPE